MASKGKQYHIQLEAGQVGDYVLLPGDPGRVELIASFLDEPGFVHENREFTTWEGKLLGRRITVMSTGIGCPSAAIASEELINVGAKTLIRAGTAGSMQSHMRAGDFALVTGAIRDEGTSKAYVPLAFPALASLDVINGLKRGVEQHLIQLESREMFARELHLGVSHSKDSYQAQHDPDSLPDGQRLKDEWNMWVKAGAICSEMEASTLFTIGAVRQVRTGGLMIVGDPPNVSSNNDSRVNVTVLAEAVVAGLRGLIEEDEK